MTLQIKGVQIAGIPAVTIRNMLGGVNQVLAGGATGDRDQRIPGEFGWTTLIRQVRESRGRSYG